MTEEAALEAAQGESAEAAIAKAIDEFHATEQALAAKAAGPLLGGYAVGEKVFYVGPTQVLPSGKKCAHGTGGVVKGPIPEDSSRLGVQFSGNRRFGCKATEISRTKPPPLPGGGRLRSSSDVHP